MSKYKLKNKSHSNKSHSVIVKLDYPVEWDDDMPVDQIELKRPKGKHLKGLGNNISMNDIFAIASKVSGYTPAFFDEMDAADCLKVSEVIGDFLDSGQKIGRTS